MKHTIYTFTLHRRGVVWVIFALVIESALFLGIGWLLGSQRTRAAIANEAADTAPTDSEGGPTAGAAGEAAADANGLGVFAVQVAELVDEAAVQPLVDDLVKRGYEAYFVTKVDAGERKAFGIRIGRYDERSDATKAAEEFVQRESRNAVVVREL